MVCPDPERCPVSKQAGSITNRLSTFRWTCLCFMVNRDQTLPYKLPKLVCRIPALKYEILNPCKQGAYSSYVWFRDHVYDLETHDRTKTKCFQKKSALKFFIPFPVLKICAGQCFTTWWKLSSKKVCGCPILVQDMAGSRTGQQRCLVPDGTKFLLGMQHKYIQVSG